VADERAVRDALRPILSTTRSEAGVFDRAFSAFFFPGPPGVRQAFREAPGRGDEPKASRSDSGADADRDRDDAGEEPGGRQASETVARFEPVDADGAPAARRTVASYSPVEIESAADAPELARPAAAWREAARALVRRQELGLSRRWRSSPRGRRFDLRRTLRASVQTGGEALSARWLRRPRRTPRFVLLVDGSRSMGAYALTGLHVAVALAAATMRVEAFTFSTALHRVTNDVRRAAAGETRRVGRLRHAWAGGTSIGMCLHDFLQRYGDRFIVRDTIVFIVSDGLDVGAVDVLRRAMRTLHRRSAAVVWLNPLLETPGYEPTAAGMRAARPYVTTFASVTDVTGFTRLSRLLRVRR
jgi:uncharacterized protein